MPYTLAIMEEIFRHSSIIGAGAQHKALADKEYKGYLIPKDAWIFPNIYFLHHNKEVWEDHNSFRPQRFLSDDQKTFKKHESVMPFQIGRRQCPGETLARDTFFLYLTNIFQKFSITMDPNAPEPDTLAKGGFILAPKDFSVKLLVRNAH